MINGQWHIAPTAVLTSMIVTTENIFARKDDFLEGETNKDRKAHHARERHGHRYGMKHHAVMRFDKLCFPEEQQDNCFLDIANTQWLIVLVENEHLRAKLSVTASVMRTEDYTSFSIEEFN